MSHSTDRFTRGTYIEFLSVSICEAPRLSSKTALGHMSCSTPIKEATVEPSEDFSAVKRDISDYTVPWCGANHESCLLVLDL